MKKTFTIITVSMIIFACNSNPEKEKITELLKVKIGGQLPFKDVKIAKIEHGTGAIVDGSWCYWIDENDSIFCVNGTSKTIYNVSNPKCIQAPINAGFTEIEKIAK